MPAGYYPRPSAVQRFERLYTPEPNSGCWLWTGGTTTAGYGIFLKDGKSTTAHRASYELFVGEIPEGFDVDHLCRVRCCVNPDHLEAVTRKENLIRSPNTFSSIHSKKTHCPRGHPYEGDNLYLNPANGDRQCVTCRTFHGKNRTRKGIPA